MLADRPGSSGRDLWLSGSLGLLPCADSAALSGDWVVLESSDFGAPSPAAAAACCWAISFRDAFPRFLRSRIYSHVKPNSDVCVSQAVRHGSTQVTGHERQR